MLKIWLGLVFGFFAFAVDDPKDPPADAPADTEEQPELDLGGTDPDPDPQDDPEPDPAAQLAEERAARAKAEAQSEAHQRELAELRSGQRSINPTEDQKLFEREESRLKDEKTTDLERWQIAANRKLRENTNSSTAALFQAQDISDKTSFRQLEVTKPALFKRYATRVEEELGKMRKTGGNAPREAILRFLIGNDAMEGKLAPKKKASAAEPGAGAINRGKLPGARSDVRGKTTMSEHEKRRARLENVQI